MLITTSSSIQIDLFTKSKTTRVTIDTIRVAPQKFVLKLHLGFTIFLAFSFILYHLRGSFSITGWVNGATEGRAVFPVRVHAVVLNLILLMIKNPTLNMAVAFIR